MHLFSHPKCEQYNGTRRDRVWLRLCILILVCVWFLSCYRSPCQLSWLAEKLAPAFLNHIQFWRFLPFLVGSFLCENPSVNFFLVVLQGMLQQIFSFKLICHNQNLSRCQIISLSTFLIWYILLCLYASCGIYLSVYMFWSENSWQEISNLQWGIHFTS